MPNASPDTRPAEQTSRPYRVLFRHWPRGPLHTGAAYARAARLYASLQRWRRAAETETARRALDESTRLVLLAIEALDAGRDDEAGELIAEAEAALSVGEALEREGRRHA